MSGTQGQNGNRSFWTTMPGIITAIAALLTAIGGLIGGLYAVGWIGQKPSPSPSSSSSTVTQQGPAPPSSPGSQQAPPSTMDVNVTADPPQFPPGGRTTIFVEVLSAPASPIKDAEVQIEVGDSLFTGTTNTHGYYAAEWTSPAPISGPLDYFVTVTVTKPGYKETSKRITIQVRSESPPSSSAIAGGVPLAGSGMDAVSLTARSTASWNAVSLAGSGMQTVSPG